MILQNLFNPPENKVLLWHHNQNRFWHYNLNKYRPKTCFSAILTYLVQSWDTLEWTVLLALKHTKNALRLKFFYDRYLNNWNCFLMFILSESTMLLYLLPLVFLSLANGSSQLTCWVCGCPPQVSTLSSLVSIRIKAKSHSLSFLFVSILTVAWSRLN